MFASYKERGPLAQKATKLVIMLHGIGSNSDDMLSLVPYLQPALPDFHFLSPDGIQKYDLTPFGYQWFSMKSKEASALQNELHNMHITLNQHIIDCLDKFGMEYKDLIFMGFSQGTMASLYLTIVSKLELAGLVGFSGAFIEPKSLTHNSINTPICLIHGEEDEILKPSYMHQSASLLRKYNPNIESYMIPKLAHSIDYSGIQIAINFIKRCCYEDFGDESKNREDMYLDLIQ